MQHSILVPAISHHVLLYDSLLCLEKKLEYKFEDLHLLHVAITHPSTSTVTYSLEEDDVKNALSNGGLKWYVNRKELKPKKKLKALVAELEGGEKMADESERLQNNEQLEYLGDALLEYLCR